MVPQARWNEPPWAALGGSVETRMEELENVVSGIGGRCLECGSSGQNILNVVRKTPRAFEDGSGIFAV